MEEKQSDDAHDQGHTPAAGSHVADRAGASHQAADSHAQDQGHGPVPAAKTSDPHGAQSASTHAPPAHAPAHGPTIDQPQDFAKGVQFVNAIIEPMDHELNHRFWGWRPNDILNFTDNVNNFQLGVLEVTRRATVQLTERISRMGSAANIDDNLEQAMNWFMIKPTRYWLPSPEEKYNDGLNELRKYAERLERGEAHFYTRTDNLIPLLVAFQDLLGSCDENLVKAVEEDGTQVSFFKADNYFFYAKGVATAMSTILETIHIEFHTVLESRYASEAMHHAIESCHRAIKIDPWIILDSSLSSVFANHRANMAAPISHARFYLGVVIRVLST
jgi:hypothetical protein